MTERSQPNSEAIERLIEDLLQASVDYERAEKFDAKYRRKDLEDAKTAIRTALQQASVKLDVAQAAKPSGCDPCSWPECGCQYSHAPAQPQAAKLESSSDDLVQLLREGPADSALTFRAADEIERLRAQPATLWGQIAAIYGKLDTEDCARIDREWAKMRGYILPVDGSARLYSAQPQAAPKISFMEAMNMVERGFDTWKDKPHNAKWYNRIDGTPIPNDLKVNIAEAIRDYPLSRPLRQMTDGDSK